MKAIPVRTAAALAMLLALGACGGKASFELSGTIVDAFREPKPLANEGLVLANGDQRLIVPLGATTFKFPQSISYGDTYAITVSQQPRHMSCSFVSGSVGTAGRTATISAALICNQNAYPIGGKVQGLGSGTLELVNGTDKVSVTNANNAASVDFTMPSNVPDGTVYGVTVLTQPTGQKCTVANGTDVMGEAGRSNIIVTCTNI
ncbi:hypothetical protein GCM10027277_14620 [Pseudoduganella ginsengisoli]|uniref:Lipoprotein n=1 Tax=Pseudoduganella ginsengisoli TaxID=1462440 RepID=A0A6L6PUW0_9BURK|nr:hypothetical protein [Pseudoduganella ginsengisoli]MTW01277.1 hypothetical protein [Pseudoduganella ginsengisoli]